MHVDFNVYVHLETCNPFIAEKINADNIVQALIMKYECFTCSSAYATMHDFDWLTYVSIFFYVIF